MLLIAFSALCGMLGAWFMARYAYRFGLLDIPNDRSSHTLPTPRGGGIGILVAFAGASAAINAPLLFWVPAALLALVSFFDDRLCLSPGTRLAFQFAAAVAVCLALKLHAVLYGGGSPLVGSLLLVPVVCIFLVGTANFFNFMDGINGIAGIAGGVALALVGFFAWQSGHVEPFGVVAISLSAACFGFLPLNLPRAKVFMGDVGSILLGFAIATLSFALSDSVGDVMVMAGFLFPFYADTLSTLFVRWSDGERLSQAHRRHIYQLLVNQRRFAHWKVALGYGIVQLLVGFIFMALRGSSVVLLLGVWLFLIGAWWGVSSALRKRLEVSVF